MSRPIVNHDLAALADNAMELGANLEYATDTIEVAELAMFENGNVEPDKLRGVLNLLLDYLKTQRSTCGDIYEKLRALSQGRPTTEAVRQ